MSDAVERSESVYDAEGLRDPKIVRSPSFNTQAPHFPSARGTTGDERPNDPLRAPWEKISSMPASFVSPRDFGLSIGAQPVRKIEARTDRPSMPGWFPTRKGTRPSLRTESLLELDGLEQFEINPDVVLMAAQPHHLAFFETQPDGSTIRRIYTPDAALQMRDGTISVVDFKVAKFARQDAWQKQEALLEHLYERDHGAVFSTVTDEDIRLEPRFQNAKIMMLHRPIVDDVEAEAAVMAALDGIEASAAMADIKAHCDLVAPHRDVDRAFSATIALALKGVLDLDLSEMIGPQTRVSKRGAP